MLIQELKALGLPAYGRELTLGVRGTMRRVLVGPYDVAADAELALERVHQMPDYTDARVRRLNRGR
jgi:cell division septation protein DedD